MLNAFWSTYSGDTRNKQVLSIRFPDPVFNTDAFYADVLDWTPGSIMRRFNCSKDTAAILMRHCIDWVQNVDNMIAE